MSDLTATDVIAYWEREAATLARPENYNGRMIAYSIGAMERLHAMEELVHHLRHCRECAEMDIIDCHSGKELWANAFNGEQP